MDQEKWRNLEEVREIANGKARLNVQAKDQNNTISLKTSDNNIDYFEANFLVESGSAMSTGAEGYSRIIGSYYNETGVYDGSKNNVWVSLRISIFDDGSLFAYCSLWKATASDESTGEYLLWQQFTTSLSLNTEYTLSIERNGAEFIFRLNDESIIYNVTTPMYEPSNGQEGYIQSRVYADPGETGYIKTTIDDVVTTK